MKGTELTVAEIRRRLQEADAPGFAVLERALAADARTGVRAAVGKRRAGASRPRRPSAGGWRGSTPTSARWPRRAAARWWWASTRWDVVPWRGPLAVGACVLPAFPLVEGLNDSKQVKPEARERVAARVKETALAWTVQYVDAETIDAAGMAASLVKAFRAALAAIEAAGVHPDVVLVDGNPLHMDGARGERRQGRTPAAPPLPPRRLSPRWNATPSCAAWRNGIRNTGSNPTKAMRVRNTSGPSGGTGSLPVHRATFCTAFTQPTLF